MIVARIRTMKNRTDDTTMREEVNENLESFIVPAVVVLINIVVGNNVVDASGVMNVDLV